MSMDQVLGLLQNPLEMGNKSKPRTYIHPLGEDK